MPVRKLSIALSETVAKKAALAARRRGLSLSSWLNAAAENALLIDAGLAAVSKWESEHGPLSEDELARADALLDRKTRRR